MNLSENSREPDSEKSLDNELLPAIVDTMGALLVVLDAEGRIVRFNRACEITTGYSFSEVKGKRVWEFLIPKEELDGVITTCNQLSAGNFPNKHENHWLTKCGKAKLISWSNTAITNSQNKVEFIIGTGIEITSQRDAEKTLIESEGQYRTIISAMNEGFVFQRADGGLLACNPSAEKILGLTKVELEGTTSVASILKTVQADGTPMLAAQTPASVTFETGKPCNKVVMGIYRKDGNLVWLRVNTQPVFNNGNKKPDSVVISFSDITEIKRAEEDMWHIKRAVEWTSDAIKMTNTQRESIYHNRAFIKLLGYTPKELNEHGGAAILYKDKEVEEEIDRLLEKGKTFQGEVELRCKKGEIIPVEMTADVVQDDAGRIIGRVAIFNDIRERRRIEHQLRQTLKMEAVGRLAGGVAHDFNNMLTAISGYSELSLRQVDDDSPLKRNLYEIKKAAERSADLTGKLLAFSRRQTQKLKVLNINNVIEEMRGMLEPLIGEELEIINDLESNIGQIKADSGQVEQILMNLVVNARDAMPEGGKIVVQTRNIYLDEEFVKIHPGAAAGSYIMLSVTDNGVGMNYETRARIFEPFFTTKEPGKGTGLGLATVYGIVKQSNGLVTVESEAGRGTSFKIYLPRVNQTIQNNVQISQLTKASNGGETVLLTEDEELVRNLAAEVLTLNGYKVLMASSGEEALAVCRSYKGKINLLITDVVMSGINGYKLAELVRQIRSDIEILLISGYSKEVISNKNNPKIAFLEKPFTPELLTAKVRKILDFDNNVD